MAPGGGSSSAAAVAPAEPAREVDLSDENWEQIKPGSLTCAIDLKSVFMMPTMATPWQCSRATLSWKRDNTGEACTTVVRANQLVFEGRGIDGIVISFCTEESSTRGLTDHLLLVPVVHNVEGECARPKAVAVADEAEDVYEAEKILNVKGSGKRKRYLVKWKGYNEEEATWEPATNINDGIILRYENGDEDDDEDEGEGEGEDEGEGEGEDGEEGDDEAGGDDEEEGGCSGEITAASISTDARVVQIDQLRKVVKIRLATDDEQRALEDGFYCKEPGSKQVISGAHYWAKSQSGRLPDPVPEGPLATPTDDDPDDAKVPEDAAYGSGLCFVEWLRGEEAVQPANRRDGLAKDYQRFTNRLSVDNHRAGTKGLEDERKALRVGYAELGKILASVAVPADAATPIDLMKYPPIPDGQVQKLVAAEPKIEEDMPPSLLKQLRDKFSASPSARFAPPKPKPIASNSGGSKQQQPTGKRKEAKARSDTELPAKRGAASTLAKQHVVVAPATQAVVDSMEEAWAEVKRLREQLEEEQQGRTADAERHAAELQALQRKLTNTEQRYTNDHLRWKAAWDGKTERLSSFISTVSRWGDQGMKEEAKEKKAAEEKNGQPPFDLKRRPFNQGASSASKHGPSEDEFVFAVMAGEGRGREAPPVGGSSSREMRALR